ncbi:hypothetical protein [Archaeoglobus sp.]
MKIKIVKIKAKRAFNPTKIPGADYVVNQYVGCQHACKYCYAKFMCRWYNYGRWAHGLLLKTDHVNHVSKCRIISTEQRLTRS